MAREIRKESPTGYYHVMMRGNNKEMIFRQAAEKQYFIEQLLYQVEEGNILLVAYCIMDNHVHLLIHSDMKTMIESLKWINIKFAVKFNYKYERVGHVFQDRFKSEVIYSDEHLVQVIRYIHNNPVKAKITSEVSYYKWSSYKGYADKGDRIIDPKEKQMIIMMFSGSIKQFEKFHLEQEINEFLEIKEDLEREREERAKGIINKFCEKYGIKEIKEISNSKNFLEEIIMELLNKSHLPHRKIAEITDTTRGIVHSISKKI